MSLRDQWRASGDPYRDLQAIADRTLASAPARFDWPITWCPVERWIVKTTGHGTRCSVCGPIGDPS